MSLITSSIALRGVHALPVEVEARTEREGASVSIIGLPDAACRESSHRVRGAILTVIDEALSGQTIVSLAPANLPKSGSGFDLAICLSVLAAIGRLSIRDGARRIASGIFLGELTLRGTLRAVPGSVAAAELARREGRVLILPRRSASLAALVPGVEIVAVDSLQEIVSILRGLAMPRPFDATDHSGLDRGDPESAAGVPGGALQPSLAQVCGQPEGVRAAIVAAAGGHGLLMSGPPGCGKSLIARCMPGILPPLSDEEYVEIVRMQNIISSSERLPSRTRPFRAPHHTTSSARLVGGGSPPRPGEVSLAHRGVLFLDEMPEFKRDAIDALRESLENGYSVVSRVKGSVTYPSRFELIAAMNPCPCGWFGDRFGRCKCREDVVKRYAGRISGPILDRIDLHVQLPPVAAADLESGGGVNSSEAGALVLATREIQGFRLGDGARAGVRGQTLNANMVPAMIEEHCSLDAGCTQLIAEAVDRFGLSARGRARTLCVARTLADMASVAEGKSPAEAAGRPLSAQHISDALSYRLVLTGDSSSAATSSRS